MVGDKQDLSQESCTQKKEINEETIPVMNSDVSIREEMEEEGQFVLFNAENDYILVINRTGKFILESCDGKRSIKEIAGLIRSSYEINEEQIDLNHVVIDFVTRMSNAELVKFLEVA